TGESPPKSSGQSKRWQEFERRGQRLTKKRGEMANQSILDEYQVQSSAALFGTHSVLTSGREYGSEMTVARDPSPAERNIKMTSERQLDPIIRPFVQQKRGRRAVVGVAENHPG